MERVASKLEAEAFDHLTGSAGDQAVLLGALSVFGGVPTAGLRGLVDQDEIPLLVVRQGQGLDWSHLRDLASSDELFEAPFELRYAAHDCGISDLDLGGWRGEDALFPGEGFTSVKVPWVGPALEFAFSALRGAGWRPHAIRMVEAPAGEEVPLACRVWRKRASRMDELAVTFPSLYREAPELVEFPAEYSRFAALGSRFWNVDHPKTTVLIQAFALLKDLMRSHNLAANKMRLVRYLTSNANYGFVVPSRIAGKRLAMEVPNRLAAIAAEEGMISPVELTLEDFVPNTLGTYQNPYHYDLRRWASTSAGVGKAIRRKSGPVESGD